MNGADRRPGSPSAVQRPRAVRRVVKLLVVVDLCIVVAALALWQLRGSGDEEANAVNGRLRGSRPPAAQLVPRLSTVTGLEPAFPPRSQLDGAPLMVVGTCIDCRSGDVIGGFLGRLGADDLPDGVRVEVVGWDGDVAAWRREQRIPRSFVIHAARTPAATDAVQGLLSGISDSGRAYLYDGEGRWRSTFHLGQLTRDDVLHDLDQLADEA